MRDAGELKQRVIIQRKRDTKETNKDGFPQDDWVDVSSRRASVKRLSGKEFYQARAVYAEVSIKVEMRYMAGITPKMRILYKDRKLDIIAVDNVKEQNRELVIMCKEVV